MKIKSKVVYWIILVLSSVFIGLINGFFGGGGGMVTVPLLEEILNIDNKKSHATAMLIIFPLSLISAITYALHTKINFIDILYTSIGVLVGGILGALLLKRLNNKVVRIIFIFVMLSAGIKILI